MVVMLGEQIAFFDVYRLRDITNNMGLFHLT